MIRLVTSGSRVRPTQWASSAWASSSRRCPTSRLSRSLRQLVGSPESRSPTRIAIPSACSRLATIPQGTDRLHIQPLSIVYQAE